MRVVFCGTATFAVPSLQAVAAHHDVRAVVTQPDRAGSRGKPALRPVAEAARELGITVLRPERIRAEDSVAAILAMQPDALVVAAYGQIIPSVLLDAPAFGGVNVHASLLPRWRGAAPVAAAILAGDPVTGVTIMHMDPGLDTGPLFAARTEPIGADDTTPRLTERLARLGADLLLEVLDGVAGGRLAATPQDPADATVAPRLTRADATVDWAARTAVDVDRHVRALQPWPGTTAPLGGAEVRVLAGAAVADDDRGASPGAIIEVRGDAVLVATASGAYRVDMVQPPGGRPMSAAAFLRGRRAH